MEFRYKSEKYLFYIYIHRKLVRLTQFYYVYKFGLSVESDQRFPRHSHFRKSKEFTYKSLKFSRKSFARMEDMRISKNNRWKIYKNRTLYFRYLFVAYFSAYSFIINT